MSEALRLRAPGMPKSGMPRMETPAQASQAYGAAQTRALPGKRLDAAPAAKQRKSEAGLLGPSGLLGHWALWGAAIGLLAGGAILGASFSTAPKPVRVFPVPVAQLPGAMPAAMPAPSVQVRPHLGEAASHAPTIVVNNLSRLMPGESEREILAPPPPPKGIEPLALPTELPPPAAMAEPVQESKLASAEPSAPAVLPPQAMAAPPQAMAAPLQAGSLAGPAQKPAAKPAAAPAALAAPAMTTAPSAGGERWRKLGVPMPAGAKPPFIAIVIDDMGLARRNSTRAVALPAPLTLSYMSYAPDLSEQAAAARAAGHELMLHLPMEPLDAKRNNPGPYALLVNQEEGEWRRRVNWSLDRFEGYAGVNNHMGSRFTADAEAMGIVLSEIHKRGLFWLDSLTGPRSTGVAQAGRIGMAATGRDLFLDDERDAEAGVPAQLAILERIAREHGDAIGIGHPHAQTLNALERWLVDAPKRGFTLISASAMLKYRLEGRQAPNQAPNQVPNQVAHR